MRIDWNLISILSLISTEIPENDLTGLGEMYISLSKSKYCRIELASHKNGVGNYESDLRLSQRYSDTVKAYLVYKGIYESRILAKGYGEKQSKISNDTDVDKASFRRTELRFIQKTIKLMHCLLVICK